MTLNHHQIASVFDPSASTYGADGSRFFHYFGSQLVSLLKPASGITCLDIATGTGAILRPLSQAIGPQGKAYGIDLSAKMLEETAKHTPGNVSLHVMDGVNPQFPDASFDLITVGFALQFFDDLPTALSNYRRLLKPNGRLAVVQWGPPDTTWSWFWEMRAEYGSLPNLEQNNLCNADHLAQLLDNAGFQHPQITSEIIVHDYQSKEQWWQSLWSHLQRAVLESLSTEEQNHLKQRAFARIQEPKETLSTYYAITHSL